MLARLPQAQSRRVLLRNGINPKRGFKIPCQQLIQVLVLCCQPVLCNRQVILRLGQTRSDLQLVSPEHGLLCDVTQRNSLCLVQSSYSFPCCIHRSLGGNKLKICTSHFGRDLLALCANVFFRDIAPKFGGANSQPDFVLLRQGHIHAASQVGGQLCWRVNLGIVRWDGPGPWIGPENPLGKSEVKWLQQFATECGELEVWQAPAASCAHLEVILLRF